MKLYFSRNPNPRLAVAVARFLGFEGAFAHAAPLAPGQSDRFRPEAVGKLGPGIRR